MFMKKKQSRFDRFVSSAHDLDITYVDIAGFFFLPGSRVGGRCFGSEYSSGAGSLPDPYELFTSHQFIRRIAPRIWSCGVGFVDMERSVAECTEKGLIDRSNVLVDCLIQCNPNPNPLYLLLLFLFSTVNCFP